MNTNLDHGLGAYADLSVNIGLNLQPGQRLLVRSPLDAAPLVRRVAAAAYQRGARLVDILWSDDQVHLARFQYAPDGTFEEFPVWRTQAILDFVRSGDALLTIRGEDPDLLKEQDTERVNTYLNTYFKHLKPARDLLSHNATNWSIVSYPAPAWAAKIFPDLPAESQVESLWQTLRKLCRLDQPDPVLAWQEHVRQLSARCDYMNARSYHALRFRGPGTDLTVGLPQGHIWLSGQFTSENGILFTANLPTEEIFTIPDKNRTEGVVTATMPLSHGGTLIEGFSLRFSGGRVVEAHAQKGEAVLSNLLETDEGASRLGEVALVPHSSPIAQSGRLFFNTLLDENAADHIALGQAYRFTLRGGMGMSVEEFAAAGGNNSLQHVDFMIGSGVMDVDGVTSDGQTEAVMRSGEWAFRV